MKVKDRRESSCDDQSLGGKGQNRVGLLMRDSRKPFDEIVHRGTCFEIFKESRYGDTRPFEDPDATDSFRVLLNLCALTPIKHKFRVLRFVKRASVLRGSLRLYEFLVATDLLWLGAQPAETVHFADRVER